MTKESSRPHPSQRPRRVGLLAIAIVVGTAGLLLLRARDRNEPINLVIVSIDTLRADHLGAYGYPPRTTPFIDRFARSAVTFREFIANAPSTLASHASLFTSLHPSHHGASVVAGTRVWPGATTLAEVLSEAGYATASFNGGHQLDPSYGLARGFDVYECSRGAADGAETLVGPETTLAATVRQGIAWLRGVRRPFFLFLHSYEIHHPYTPAPIWLQAMDRDYAGALPDSISVEWIQKVNAVRRPLSREDLRHVIAAYDAELRSADRAFGDLLDFLDESGLEGSTVVVLLSDHGEEFGERGFVGWHSHTLFDELLHVPAILRLPELRERGSVVSGQVRGIDLAPTLLAVLGRRAPSGFSGRDLSSAIARRRSEDRATLVKRDKAQPDSLRLRTGSWKLYNAALFDLRDDPRESSNVVSRHPDVAHRLRETQRELLQERPTPAPTPTNTDPEVLERLRSLGYVD